jgi:hypothetical protein
MFNSKQLFQFLRIEVKKRDEKMIVNSEWKTGVGDSHSPLFTRMKREARISKSPDHDSEQVLVN